jgi:hypothetical protein
MAATPLRRESRKLTGTQLVVRATRDERAAVHATAAKLGTNASDLIRMALKAQGVPIER